MTLVVLSGSGDSLARRLSAHLAADPQVERVIHLIPDEPHAGQAVNGHGANGHPTLDDGELKATIDRADVVIDVSGGARWGRRLLDAASSASVKHVVLLSDATVYGAWANNPVPLTEDAPLRPNPDLQVAVEAGELERLAVEWRDRHPESTLAVLRPTVTVAAGETGALARGLDAAAAIKQRDEQPPAQYLHLDDLAAAVDLARREHLDGAFNVAPDGWMSGEAVQALAGRPRLRLPERLAVVVTRLKWQFGLAATPPGLLPYTIHPWVIANDRLRAAGWRPEHTNEETYVAAHEAGPLATLSPRRRQELALGVAGAAVVSALVGAALAARRWHRRGR